MRQATLRRLLPFLLSAFACAMPFLCHAEPESKVRLKTVVLDPGHGGHDPGCQSRDGKTKEKNLVLSISRLVGNKIKAAFPDVKVIYTRTTDVFIPLNERAEIANRNKADLFISIHINAFDTGSPSGTSAHVLGPSSNKNRDTFSENMELCRRENSVILLEDDYTTTYQGFNPNDPESYIIFNLLQNAHLQQNYPGKVAVALYLAHIRPDKDHLVLIHQLRAGGEENIVCAASALSAQLIGGVPLEHQLAGAGILPAVCRGVIPGFFIQFFQLRLGIFYKGII